MVAEDLEVGQLDCDGVESLRRTGGLLVGDRVARRALRALLIYLRELGVVGPEEPLR